MLGQPISLIGLFVAVWIRSTEAINATVAESLAIDPVGRPRSSVVRSERQHLVAVEPHIVSGAGRYASALGEMGNSFISEAGAEALGARVAAVFQRTPHKPQKASVIQSNRSKDPDSPTLSVSGKIYLRQPAEHKGTYKTREWFCDACQMLAGKGKLGGETPGCYTVTDFVCAGGEQCLMDEKTCYFGRVELPQGVQVTYYSGFAGEPEAGGWDNACIGRTDRGTTSDPSFPELKGIVPTSGEPVCAMKFETVSGYTCDSAAGAEDWKSCGTEGYPPPESRATACSSLFLAAAAVLLSFCHS